MNRVRFPLGPHMQEAAVADLHGALHAILDARILMTDHEELRRQWSQALEVERSANSYGAVTQELVEMFQSARKLSQTGEVDEATADALNRLIGELKLQEPAVEFLVDGRIVSWVSPAVAGLRVVVIDRVAGEDEIVAETTTDSRGQYKATFPAARFLRRGKRRPDLQVHVFAGDHEVGASSPRYQTPAHATLDVVISDGASRALQSEYEALRAELSSRHDGPPTDLEESGQRRDVTCIANKSGWDARAVAMAALSEQLSQRTAATIEPALFYGLFRAGVPANENALYRIDPKALTTIWSRCIDQGVIPVEMRDRLPTAVEQFQQLASRQLLENEPSLGVSGMKELVALSIGNKPGEHHRVAALYTQYGDDKASFWEAVRSEIGDDAADRLRLNGQLAHLTINNAPLIRKLHAKAVQSGITSPIQLTGLGLYRAEKWRELIGNDAVPPEIVGEDDDERRDRYAELLAAQVRLSFPTAAIAEMVASGETPVGNSSVTSEVAAFLREHSGDFEVGLQSIAQYVLRNEIQVEPGVKREIARIQRVYQITPTDDAMNGLLRNNIDSPQKVVDYTSKGFVRKYADTVGGELNAKLIHAKAHQVHAAVLNRTCAAVSG